MSELLLKDKLRELREKMNYTQEYVGRYLNMTRQGYAHYESGERHPDSQTLLKLARLYDINIDELINAQTTPLNSELLRDTDHYNYKKPDSKEPAASSRIIQLSSDEKKLFNLYSKLSKEGKKELLEYLERKTREEMKN